MKLAVAPAKIDRENILEAKRRLPLPQLMAQLGKGDAAKQSARCPFHEDSSNSFSIFQTADGRHGWKCFAGCGQGDEIDFLAKLKGFANGSAVTEFLKLAGVTNGAAPSRRESLDWPKCVADFTEAKVEKLAAWRGLSVEFVRWLHQQGTVGLHEGNLALANHGEGGKVVSAHVRLTNGKWSFKPKGQRTAPLVFGDTKAAGFALVFESQWDAFAVMDKLGWHAANGLPDAAVLITRGASNGKLIRGQVSPDAVCCAFKQNDAPTPEKPIPAGDTWLADIASNAGCRVVNVTTPPPHKDANDWTRAGATKAEIEAAIASAKEFQPQAGALVVLPAEAAALTPDTARTEFEFATLLAKTLPPIKTVGPAWHAYNGGAWRQIEAATLKPQALAILPEPKRTVRAAATLLDHIEAAQQVGPDTFKGFYAYDAAGAVLLNVANGVLRVTPNGFELLPHAAGYHFTRQTVAQFNPDATAPLFERVLCEVLPDVADRVLFQHCLGNFLLPDCRHEIALVCYGEAGRGKSTVADPVAAALGLDLVSRLSMSQVCDPRSYHLPMLRHVPVNLGTELTTADIAESGNFKTLVSGEPIEARPIYGKPFVMQTSCKLWFLANSLPRFKYGTEAELRRTRFLRFDYQPPAKDVTLKTRLAGELDGVFLLMLDGLRQLLTRPQMPLGSRESRAVAERFRVSNDPVGAFVQSHCILDPEARASKDTLRDAFADFSTRHELPAVCADWFFRVLFERFTNLCEVRPCVAGERVRSVQGIRLRSPVTLESE